jgi:hypothetical protein
VQAFAKCMQREILLLESAESIFAEHTLFFHVRACEQGLEVGEGDGLGADVCKS